MEPLRCRVGLLPILAFYPDLMRDMVLYGVLRLALWAVIWWLLTVAGMGVILAGVLAALIADRKSTRLNSSHIL